MLFKIDKIVKKGDIRIMKKSVIITGGSSGYGLAAAKAFKKAGYTVCIVARKKDALEKAQAESGSDYIFPMDVTSFESWKELDKFVKDKFGKVDVLINNAGGGIAIQPIEKQTKKIIDDVIALNLTSAIYAANVFVPEMKERRSGTIINVASVCATHAWADWSVYAAAKAGLRSFTKGLHCELQPYGVRMTCIIPAAANTNFSAACHKADSPVSLKPEDIASAMLFAAEMPDNAVVEEVTVWGMSQIVQPL